MDYFFKNFNLSTDSGRRRRRRSAGGGRRNIRVVAGEQEILLARGPLLHLHLQRQTVLITLLCKGKRAEVVMPWSDSATKVAVMPESQVFALVKGGHLFFRRDHVHHGGVPLHENRAVVVGTGEVN